MASLPHSSASHQRPSRHAADNAAQGSADRSDSTSPQTQHSSVSPDDTRTVLFDSSVESFDAVSAPATPAEEPRKCWICFADETEDTPLSSEWRSPCPCALTAHESCLLDWIANIEAPGSRRGITQPGQIRCPQCKSEIKLARPRSLVVDAVRGLEHGAERLMIPGILVISCFTIVQGLLMHGVSTVYAVFGLAEGEQILEPLLVPHYILLSGRTDSALEIIKHTLSNWRLSLGLPLIPPILVLSRTSMADHVLPIVPMLFFIGAPNSNELLSIAQWPPSPSLTFAMLPYLRGAYNAYYELVWRERVQKWMREIKPLPGNGDNQEQDDEGDEEGQIVADDEADGLLEIDVAMDLVGGWNQDGGAPRQDQPPRRPDTPIAGGALDPEEHLNHIPRPGQADQAAQPVPQLAAAAQPPDADDHHHHHHENAIAFNLYHIADTVLGALAFPGIAAAMGEALRLILPLAWTRPPGTLQSSWFGKSYVTGRPTGLLQQRWGRTVIGGCLFVVLKDAVMLYVKWKMAQLHRQRRVLDYDRKKSREKSRETSRETSTNHSR